MRTVHACYWLAEGIACGGSTGNDQGCCSICTPFGGDGGGGRPKGIGPIDQANSGCPVPEAVAAAAVSGPTAVGWLVLRLVQF